MSVSWQDVAITRAYHEVGSSARLELDAQDEQPLKELKEINPGHKTEQLLPAAVGGPMALRR